MTEIKITFAKVEAKKILDANQPTNAEGLEVDISPIFFDKFYNKVPSDSCINKLKLAFFDGAEKEIYNELLDEQKVSFELSFEKEQVDFNVVGVDENEPDDSKIRINYITKDSANGSLGIVFKSQFAGVVKIISISRNNNDNNDRGNNNNGGGDKNNQANSEVTKKITNLQNRINELEKKQHESPNSNTSQQDKQELARLKSEC